jgi:pimeloyl-ACP methyl ester carboxylesterase
VTPTGYFTASNVSSVDDSEQPFALWVPRNYRSARAYPLLVALHGSDADHRMIPEECFRLHERGFREDMILLCPFGRGDLNYEWMAEADVWDAIRWVKAHYHIDARRQYLTGLSMGGYAAWRLACDYPGQWAAIAPVCGGGDPAAVKTLRRVPVWCVHGAADPLVPVEESRKMVRELQRRKFRFRYDELPGWGHNAWNWLYDPGRTDDSLADWLLRFRKATPPKPIRAPRRRGCFHDVFSERVILSYPASLNDPAETARWRAEAEQLARFTAGDAVMRSGRLLVRSDADLEAGAMSSANHVMLGPGDGHRWLRSRWGRGALRRHRAWGKKTSENAVLLSCQRSPWNARRLLALVTCPEDATARGIADFLVCAGASIGRREVLRPEGGSFRPATDRSLSAARPEQAGGK